MNLLDQLPCAVVVTNEAGRLLDVNAALLALIGGAREDRIGALFEELLPPASRIFLQTHIWPTLLRDGQISEIHLQVSGGDRTRVPVLLNSRRGEHQGAPAYFWSLVSTHERHRFEAELIEQRNLAESAGLALGESQRFIRAITDAIPSMVAYWGKDRRCRFANHAYAQWFGRQPHELIGMSREALLGERIIEWNEEYAHAALAGHEQNFERAVTNVDGSRRHILAHYVPDIAGSEVLGFFVNVSDVTALKTAQLALEEAQRLGQTGSWSWQVEGDVVTWSPQMYSILGGDPQAPAPSFEEQSRIYQPQDYAKLAERVSNALRTGEDYILDLRYCRPDGRPGWVEARGEAVREASGSISGLRGTLQETTQRREQELALVVAQGRLQAMYETTPAMLHSIDAQGRLLHVSDASGEIIDVLLSAILERDAQGQPARSLAVFEDVTLRRRAERELQREHARLRNLIEGTNAGTWEWNVRTGEVIVNPRWAEIIGWTVEELGVITNQYRADIAHPDELPQTQQLLREHFAGRSDAYVSELRLRHRDGSWIWVEDRGRLITRTADGKPEWMFGIHVDISERKRRDDAMLQLSAELAQQHELMRVTLQSIGDAVITTNAEGLVSWLNPVAERMTGWLSSESIGRPLLQVFHIINEETREPAPDPVAACLAEGKTVGLAPKTLLIARDGTEYGIQDSAAPIRSPQGEMLGVVLVFHDVTAVTNLADAAIFIGQVRAAGVKEMGVDYAQGYLKHCPEPIERLTEIAAKVGAAASPLAEQLGCAFNEGPMGPYVRTDACKMTTVPGVYAAGDLTLMRHNATLASVEGMLAGTEAHQALVFGV
eukprot:gene7047-6889_t